MKPRGLLLGALGGALAVSLLSVGAVRAQSMNFPSGGGVAAELVCLLSGGTGCTMTGSTVYSGVTNDITTGANQDLDLTPNGTGLVNVTKQLLVRNALASNLNVGTVGNAFFLVNTAAAVSAPNTSISSGRFGGDGNLDTKFMWVPRAKAITVTTDTASAPDHHIITISSSGASAWTPSETGAVSGECFRAVNTAAFVITIIESAGVYEGPAVACALGQFDALEACYITDRWVQQSCSDN